jgi:hypothetical protein
MVPQTKATVAHKEMRQAALRMTDPSGFACLFIFEDIANTSQGSN